jgi:hypothetical protein
MTTPNAEAAVIGVGASITYLTHIAAYAVLVTPLLHAMALLISSMVGIATLVWTVKKILRKE